VHHSHPYREGTRPHTIPGCSSPIQQGHAEFQNITLRIYDHALLVHVLDLLSQGTLLDGSSWFLEAFKKAWRNQLQFQSNKGVGRKLRQKSNRKSLNLQSTARRAGTSTMPGNLTRWTVKPWACSGSPPCPDSEDLRPPGTNLACTMSSNSWNACRMTALYHRPAARPAGPQP
jgi:hypothetical protein